MDPVIIEAANVLVPIAAMGAGAAVQEAATSAGRDLYGAARSLLNKLRHHMSSDSLTSANVATAIATAIDQGEVKRQDLKHIVALNQKVHLSDFRMSGISAKNFFANNTFTGSVTFQ